MAPLTADAAREIVAGRSEGFAPLALGYRNVAPLGLESVGGQSN